MDLAGLNCLPSENDCAVEHIRKKLTCLDMSTHIVSCTYT